MNLSRLQKFYYLKFLRIKGDPKSIAWGSFIGAFIGEMINDNTNQKKALKAAFGSFLGLLTSTFIKFTISSIFFGLYIIRVWEYRDILF